jgi:para-nitrobenzyl esterase
MEVHNASETVSTTLYSWPHLQWAKAAVRTGESKVYYYYFAHRPPVPPNEPYVENLGKDMGVYHGAELDYGFENFWPREWAWTDADRALANTFSQYWVNFATNGDPNGPGLPPWPAFDPGTASVQHFDSTIAPGPTPYQKPYAFWDKVAAGWMGR